jgi:hypothetical protein
MHLVPFITTLLTITAASIAAPTDNSIDTLVGTPADRFSQACPGRQIHHWQGGGCELNWGADCFNRCKNAAAGRRCCMRTVGWYQDGGGCLGLWETCECTCKR